MAVLNLLTGNTYPIASHTYTLALKPRLAAMKQKLTITVDADLIPKAKRYARSRGVSLSAVIEQSLRHLVGEDALSFADRWRGQFRLAVNRDDPRYQALAKKWRILPADEA